MKIAQFVNTMAVADGGPARNSFELNISFNQLPGVQADLYSLKGNLEESVVKNYGGEAGPLPDPGPRWISSRSSEESRRIGIRDLHRALRDVDVAIFHGYYLMWLPPMAFLLNRMGIRYVITPHGSLTDRQQQFSRRRKTVFDSTVGGWVRTKSLGFITGSPVEREELMAKFPDVTVEVGGVGTVPPAMPDEDQTWHDPLRLLSLSRIAPKKRIDLSIAALAELKREGVDAELTVAGEGPRILVEGLQELANRLGVSKHVTFVGQVVGSDKRSAFRDADVFLLPSEDENFGIGLAEALAHGVPAVTTEAVAAARFMTISTGRVLTTPTPAGVAAAVQSVAAGTRQEYALHTWQCARDNFSWSAISRQWIEALKRLSPTPC